MSSDLYFGSPFGSQCPDVGIFYDLSPNSNNLILKSCSVTLWRMPVIYLKGFKTEKNQVVCVHTSSPRHHEFLMSWAPWCGCRVNNKWSMRTVWVSHAGRKKVIKPSVCTWLRCACQASCFPDKRINCTHLSLLLKNIKYVAKELRQMKWLQGLVHIK